MNSRFFCSHANKSDKMNQTQKEMQATSLQMVKLDHSKFAVELMQNEVHVNLTQLAKPYGKSKQPSDWLRTKESEDYLKCISVPLKVGTADLVQVRQGGIPGNQGTWATNKHVALRFAQWLDPAFAVMVDDMILKLLTNKAIVGEVVNGVSPVMHNGVPLYNYREAMVSINKSPKSSPSWRKAKYPNCFVKLYGRNFITIQYFKHLVELHKYKQLCFDFEQQHALN